jgi:hypothetical protein
MITFNVVKDQHGWIIRMGEGMTTPFRSRELAVREANCLANAIRCHGACAEVIVDGGESNEITRTLIGASSVRLTSTRRSGWPDAR